jgi:hypothetical protein
MFICSIPMLTAIDRTIKFRSLVILNSRKTPDLYEGLDDVLRLYNGRGFYISRILCDGELQPLMKDVQDNMDITFNFSPAGEHIPEAEQNNRTIQERFRTQFHCLPYDWLASSLGHKQVHASPCVTCRSRSPTPSHITDQSKRGRITVY